MTLRFANPALLPWLALAAVPVVAHLLVKARPPIFRFGSLRFVRRVARSNLRLRKPWDWALLAARVLLILILVLLFSRPRLFRGTVPSVGSRRNVILVVDASASMNAVEQARTRFSTACAEAAGVVAGLRAGDRANVIWLRRGARAEFPAPGPNLNYLAEQLRRATGSQEATDVRGGLAMAANQLEGLPGDSEICLISDFQATAWRDLKPTLPSHIRVTVLPVARVPLTNTAIVSLTCRSGRAVAGLPAVFDCEVQNFSTQPQALALTLNAGEFRENREIQLSAEERRVEAFTLSLPETGQVVVSAALTPDRFPADDERFLVCEVAPRLPVSLHIEDKALRQSWEHVLGALGWVQVTNGDSEQALRICAADDPTARKSAAMALLDLTATATAARGGPWRLAAPTKDMYEAIFAGSGHGDPTLPVIQRRAATVPGERVLLRYADGVPAVALAERTLHWNLPVDLAGGDLPRHAEVLLPLVGEALLALDRQNLPPQLAHSPGARLQLPGFVPEDGVETTLVDGDSQQLGTASEPAGVLVLQPGVHAWRSGGHVLRREAVNFPIMESDLRALADPQAELKADVAASSAVALTAARDGVPLWPHLAAGGILLLIMEAALLLILRRLADRTQVAGAAPGEGVA